MTGTGSFGTTSTPLAKLFTERVVLDVRTTDPSSPETGAIWFREDLDSGADKFGELRWFDGSSTNSIPVFDKGTSGSSVEEVLGFKTADGIGFIPTISRADATDPQLSFQHGGSTLGLHNAQTNATYDSYEDGDIAEYGGDKAFYSVVDESNLGFSAQDGSKVLEVTFGGGDNNRKTISSTSGLSDYLDQDETARAWVRTGDNMSNDQGPMILWFTQSESSTPDSYGAWLFPANDTFKIVKFSGGSKSALASSSQSYNANQWYQVVINPQSNGTLNVELEGDTGTVLSSLSGSDTSYSDGGIGVYMNKTNATSTEAHVDFYRGV